MIVLAGIVLTLIVLPLTVWFYHYFNSERYLKNIPGPTPLPILGNILQMGSPVDALDWFVDLHKKYGNIYKVRTMFDTPNVIIADTKLTEEILKSYQLLHKGASYDFFHNWLGTGLLTSTDEKWKRHRRMLTPAFHFKTLEGFVDTFNKFGNILVNRLENEIGNPSFDVYKYITLYTLDVICASSMGTNVNAQKQSDSDYVKNVQEICRIICERSVSIAKSINFLYAFTNDYKAENIVLQKLHDFTDNVIANRRKELAKNEVPDEEESDLGIKRRLTFLDSMLQFKDEGKDITDLEIREEVDTFMFEGHDTTASGITNILYCLSRNQLIQETLADEINSILTDKNSEASYQDLQEMKYLEMVIKETLRLYPVAPMVSRRLPRDTVIGEYTFPKGIDVSINVIALHRDPANFPDPEKFSPERFTVENQSKRPVHSYIPFSAGPRNCIGQKFAMFEMKACVVKIVRTFKVLPPIPEQNPKFGGLIVLKSDNGVCIRLEKRNS